MTATAAAKLAPRIEPRSGRDAASSNGAAARAVPARRVVFVCQVFYPDAQSTSQLFTELLRDLSTRTGLRVTVVCGYPSALRATTADVPRRESLGGIEIRRCGMRVDVKRNMASRLLSYASFSLHAAWELLKVRKGDLVFGVTNPPFLAVMLWAASMVRRFRYQYMLLDVQPEGLIASGMMSRRSPAARVWTWLNGLSYRRAERLVVLGRDMVPLLRDGYGIDPRRIDYVPHWSAVEPTEPAAFEASATARDLGLAGKFVVQYSGNMGLWHDIETFVRAAHALRDEPDVRFLFIGGGMRRAGAEALARQLNLNNITWRDFVPKEMLTDSLAACHVSLVSLRKGLEGVAVPCKIYGILAAGRPMIAQVPADSEVGAVVREERCGVVVEPNDVNGLVAAIRRLRDDPAALDAMGRRAFAAYRAKYTVGQAVRAFETLWSCAPSGDAVIPSPGTPGEG